MYVYTITRTATWGENDSKRNRQSVFIENA